MSKLEIQKNMEKTNATLQEHQSTLQRIESSLKALKEEKKKISSLVDAHGGAVQAFNIALQLLGGADSVAETVEVISEAVSE